MARARNLKPGFFKNDLLSEIEPLGRLLFAGLWTIADREGRLEYRPKRIKAEVLPYDECDIKSLIEQLAEYGFLVVYEVKKRQYIQILNFLKHQNPHHKEQPSEIPAPDKSGASPGQVSEKPLTDPADSLNPITDSLNPITDSGASPVAPRGKKYFTPPTVEEVRDYCLERKNNINPQKFVDHYETNGWMRGSTKIKDWKACVRTWEQRDKSGGNHHGNGGSDSKDDQYAGIGISLDDL